VSKPRRFPPPWTIEEERATALIWRNAWPAPLKLAIFVAMNETLTLVCG